MRDLTASELDLVAGGDDIIVTASRPYGTYIPDSTSPFYYSGYQGSSDPAFQAYMNYHAARVTTYAHQGAPSDVVYNGDDEDVQHDANAFRNQINALDTLLDTMAGFTLTLDGGIKINSFEVQDIFHKFDYNLTVGVVYPPGYGGQTGGNATDGYYSNIDAKATLNGYELLGTAGLNYLALHEIAHNTSEIKAFEVSSYAAYITAGGAPAAWVDSAAFARVEQLSNAAARGIAQQLNVPVIPNPAYGF